MKRISGLIFSFFFATVCFAQEANIASVRLDEMVQEALEKNPDIVAAKATWDASRKRILASWALPDPMVGMDIMGEMTETRVGPQENRVMASQQIPFPWKLWEKRKVAQAKSRIEEQRYQMIRRDTLYQLKKTFYEMYEADASLLVIENIHGILSKFEEVSQSRYANQSGGQRDVAKAQAEVSMTMEQQLMFTQRRESQAVFVNALLNRSPMQAMETIAQPAKPELTLTFTELMNKAVEYRQEIKEREAILNESQHAKRLAQLENIPDANVGFVYTQVGGGTTTSPEDGKDSWMIPVSINVPLWQNRIIPEIQAAKQEVKAAEAKLLGARNETFYRVRDAYLRYESSSKIVTLYETAVLPQAELALNSDQSGYEAGKTDFLNLLDSERVYLNAKLSYVRIYTEMLKSYTDLVYVTGLEDEKEQAK